MKRLILTLLAMCVLLLVVAVPAITWNWGTADESESEPTRIVEYLADFDVAADGTMAVRESITVLFPSSPSRHGIFRFFDRADDNAPYLRRDPRDVTVRMDGEAVEFELLEESHGRFLVAKIGSATSFVSPGVHTYDIFYEIDDVLLPQGSSSRFYWNLIPGGWSQAIDNARLRVNLPGPADEVKCAVGVGSTTGCKASGAEANRLVVRAENMAPRTPLTVSAVIDHAVSAPAPDRRWTARFDPVLGSSLSALVVVLFMALAAAVAAVIAVRNTLEPKPPFPLSYAPPPGVGPAQANYMLTERTNRHSFVATVLYLAEQRAVDLKHDSSGWRITPLPGGLDRLDPVTLRTAKLLDLDIGEFHASPKSARDGAKLQSAIDGSARAVRGWASEQGLMAPAGLGSLGGITVIIAAIAAAALALFNPFNMSAVALIPGAFAACAVGLLAPGSSTRRTASGREFWSVAGGFRRVLATPSSKQRFEFSGRQELYTAYIPWAVAFGVADQWAAKYRTEMGVEPPTPTYFAGGYTGAHTANYLTQMVGDFDRTVSSAISSYQATQSSSGSSGGGGGGFSGGGGGGGGGGGSW